MKSFRWPIEVNDQVTRLIDCADDPQFGGFQLIVEKVVVAVPC